MFLTSGAKWSGYRAQPWPVRAGTKPPQLKTENGKQSMKALAVRVDPGDSTLIT
jgi:hypothetical protein